MQRSILYAVIIQGTGSVLALLTVIAIARYLGVNNQANFAICKNWFEATSTMLLLGIPQGMIYTINKGFVSVRFANRLSVIHSAAAVPVLFAISATEARIGYLPHNTGVWSHLVIAVGCAGYIYHGLARNIILTQHDGLAFSLLCVAPTVGIALVIFLQSLAGVVDMTGAFAINGSISAILAWATLWSTRAPKTDPAPGWEGVLLRQSGHYFVQSLLFVSQPFFAYALLQVMAGRIEPVGVFSFALVALIAVNSLIAMIAPILYNRWSQTSESRAMGHLRGGVLWAAVGVGSLLTAALFLCAPLALYVGGAAFAESVNAIRLLAIASIPLLFTRLAQPALMASGRTAFGSVIGAVRLGTMVLAMLGLIEAGVELVLSAAGAWALAEWCAAATLGLLLRTRQLRSCRLDSISD